MRIGFWLACTAAVMLLGPGTILAAAETRTLDNGEPVQFRIITPAATPASGVMKANTAI